MIVYTSESVLGNIYDCMDLLVDPVVDNRQARDVYAVILQRDRKRVCGPTFVIRRKKIQKRRQ